MASKRIRWKNANLSEPRVISICGITLSWFGPRLLPTHLLISTEHHEFRNPGIKTKRILGYYCHEEFWSMKDPKDIEQKHHMGQQQQLAVYDATAQNLWVQENQERGKRSCTMAREPCFGNPDIKMARTQCNGSASAQADPEISRVWFTQNVWFLGMTFDIEMDRWASNGINMHQYVSWTISVPSCSAQSA